MKLTDAFIEREWESWWAEHPEENPSADVIATVNEKLRALHILKSTSGNMRPEAAMSLYMVRPDVASFVLAKYCDAAPAIENNKKPQKRSDKYAAVYAWAENNVGSHATPKQVAEIASVSYPTALKIVATRPDVFRKVGHGVYEIRDPKKDRENS